MAREIAKADAKDKPPSRREQVAVAWSGLGFAAVGLIGWLLLPQARLVWIVLLVCGVVTIPQVLRWRLAGRRS